MLIGKALSSDVKKDRLPQQCLTNWDFFQGNKQLIVLKVNASGHICVYNTKDIVKSIPHHQLVWVIRSHCVLVVVTFVFRAIHFCSDHLRCMLVCVNSQIENSGGTLTPKETHVIASNLLCVGLYKNIGSIAFHNLRYNVINMNPYHSESSFRPNTEL